MFSKDIGIDLGTASILVYVKGKGVVLREPSVVAIDKNTGKLLKVGTEAQQMLGRTPGNIVAIRPLREGVISDYDMTERMLKEFIRKVTSFRLFKPRIVICVPSGITEVVGALLGFLLFNVYPASVFMGDTGSLALGGFVASTAYMLQMPIFIIIVGLVYLVEVVSVIIQVTYFKKTGGKRFFKMAPIHHHFELCGWSETKVVAVFSIITAILCLIALMAM